MTLQSNAAEKVLDAHYLEARARLLDLAAIFDRIDRGGTCSDHKLSQLKQAVRLLLDDSQNRAEIVQLLFSLPYDANWARPKPNGKLR